MKKILMLTIFILGCYQSYELSESDGCQTDEDCPSSEYCEHRFLCLDGETGLNCDPLRPGYGCNTTEGGLIMCDNPEVSTGTGLCLENSLCVAVFQNGRHLCP